MLVQRQLRVGGIEFPAVQVATIGNQHVGIVESPGPPGPDDLDPLVQSQVGVCGEWNDRFQRAALLRAVVGGIARAGGETLPLGVTPLTE